MFTWIYALASVIVVSLISLIGVFFIFFKKDQLEKLSFLMVSFAVGSLFGDAFIHLIPEAFKHFDNELISPILILLGILIFFILEKFLLWHHCHFSECEKHLHHHPLVIINIIGDLVHNFIDGLLIGASFLVSIPLGIATALAIILHEIPHEVGNFGIFISKGVAKKRAIFLNFLTGLAAVLGTIFALSLGNYFPSFSYFLIPLTAGGFIYVAGSDLVPELHHKISFKESFGQFFFIILGISIMFLLVFFE
jgi:zinc and cadmium transporter